MKAIVIGRHAGNIPGIEILESRAVTFPVTAQECSPIIDGLIAEAQKMDAALLFQNTPGQVAASLVSMARFYGDVGLQVGVIISKPGERLAGMQRTFVVDGESWQSAKEAVLFANPRAKVEEVAMNFVEGTTELVVTCDPPMRFEFSHIEWF